MIKKIDFHTHILPPVYKDYLDEKFDGHGDGVATPAWTIKDHLNLMEEQQIEHSLISLSSPQPSNKNTKAETLQLVGQINEFGLALQNDHPAKFSFLAALPLPYIEESVEIIRNTNAFGFSLSTNAQGLYLGDPKMDAVMEALNDKKALVTLHPTEPETQTINAAQKVKTPLMEFFFDTTRTVVNLAEHNIFSRFKDITWVIPHAGALLPVISQRISVGNKFLSADSIEQPDDLLEVMAWDNVYFDMAGMVLPYQLPTLMQIVPVDHFLYGSDFPYTPANTIEQFATILADSDVLNAEQKQQIFYENGKQLLAKLRQ